MEDESTQGKFTSIGRNDILTVAIGTPEHGGRVRGVGRGHTLSTYFGVQRPNYKHDLTTREDLEKLKKEMEAEISKLRAYNSIIDATREHNIDQSTVRLDISEDAPQLYGIYLAGPPRKLVAYGNVNHGARAVHNIPLSPDMCSVSIVRVVVGDAPIPMPTEEVQIVDHAKGTFVAWPKELAILCTGQVNKFYFKNYSNIFY